MRLLFDENISHKILSLLPVEFNGYPEHAHLLKSFSHFVPWCGPVSGCISFLLHPLPIFLQLQKRLKTRSNWDIFYNFGQGII